MKAVWQYSVSAEVCTSSGDLLSHGLIQDTDRPDQGRSSALILTLLLPIARYAILLLAVSI